MEKRGGIRRQQQRSFYVLSARVVNYCMRAVLRVAIALLGTSLPECCYLQLW